MRTKDTSLTLHTESETSVVGILNTSGVLVGSVSILYGNNYEIQVFINGTHQNAVLSIISRENEISYYKSDPTLLFRENRIRSSYSVRQFLLC